MPMSGHLTWQVEYEPGELVARGFRGGKQITSDTVATTGQAKRIQLQPHKKSIQADGRAVAVYTVSVVDDKGRVVPTAENPLRFDIQGPGKIIGVGNGNPSSLEPDVFVESTSGYSLAEGWQPPDAADVNTPVVFETTFDRPDVASNSRAWVMLSVLGKSQTATLNGKRLYANAAPSDAAIELPVEGRVFKPAGNTLRIEAVPYDDWGMREEVAKVSPLSVRTVTPAAAYTRRVFNGYAQVIVQSTGKPGNIVLRASGDNLKAAQVKVTVKR